MKILIYILRGGATFFKAEEKNKIICNIIEDERLTPDIIKSDSFNNKIKKYINENKYKTDMNISLKKLINDYYNVICSFVNELNFSAEGNENKNKIEYLMHSKLQEISQNEILVTIKNIKLNIADNHKENVSDIHGICLTSIVDFEKKFESLLFSLTIAYINIGNVGYFKNLKNSFFDESYIIFQQHAYHIINKLEKRYNNSINN